MVQENVNGGIYQLLILIHICPHLVFPTFTKTPVDIRVKAGNTARLECHAEGSPPPEVAWKKDGGDDFPAARERRMHVMSNDDVFFIVNVKAADMGVYSCTAQNVAGVIVANATLTVLGKYLIFASIFSINLLLFLYLYINFNIIYLFLQKPRHLLNKWKTGRLLRVRQQSWNVWRLVLLNLVLTGLKMVDR
jgi:hypothetical protein